jgi:DNA sulfur modification protein DndC
MEHRRKFLEQLLEIQLHIDKTNPGPSFELITKPELEAIRIQWRLDPNEPDWEDCLPTIYRKVMTDRPDLNWDVNDDFVFAGGEESLIAESCEEHGVSKELFMKLIELELSFEGYSRRSKLQEKLGELLARDWSAHEDAISRKIDQRVTVRDRDDQEAAFQARYATLMGALGDAA